MCPHILRYLTTAVITNKDVRKRRQVLKDLVKVIQQVSLVLLSPLVSPPLSTSLSSSRLLSSPLSSLLLSPPLSS